MRSVRKPLSGNSVTSAPQPTDVPSPLPRELIPDLLGRHKILLFLDYDGTISEITPAFAEARPAVGARELLGTLASHPKRISIVIVSGREIDQVRRLLGLDRNLLFAGVHGLEVTDLDGQRRPVSDISQGVADLAKVRTWLKTNVQGRSGFALEDKGVAIALHYRSADPSEALVLRGRFEAFIEQEALELKIRHGKMVAEAIPRSANKGMAVRFFLERATGAPVPVYFGDDLTDEDAFFTLRDCGVTVLVDDERRPSWAKYRVEAPSDVVEVLTDIAAVLNQASDEQLT